MFYLNAHSPKQILLDKQESVSRSAEEETAESFRCLHSATATGSDSSGNPVKRFKRRTLEADY